MTPREIVAQLDQHIIGQEEAKKAIAVAVRNRWRRQQVDPELQQEIMPKNILMIGPTGVGKTEISRRLAKLVHAPFIKVEATKFTQIGYVGKNVDSIIRDLTEVAYNETRDAAVAALHAKAEIAAEETLLDKLLPNITTSEVTDSVNAREKMRQSREKMRIKLRAGELDDSMVEIAAPSHNVVHLMGHPGMEEMTDQLQQMLGNLPKKNAPRKIKIKDAWKILIEQEAAALLDEEEVRQNAIYNVEQNGIVFIDEFDKITDNASTHGDVSREGVQRDLLPLIEGCTINTKFGNIKTDHILFVASGAFHQTKPSDLIAEIQGRLPIRVELKSLTIEDFKKILNNTRHPLLTQYSAMLKADGIQLKWLEDGITRIVEIAWEINERQENIGARRLHTVLERLLTEISYEAPDTKNKTLNINASYVDEQLGKLIKDKDLAQFIL